MSISYDEEKISNKNIRTKNLIEVTMDQLAPETETSTTITSIIRVILRQALIEFVGKLEKEGAIFP